MLAFSADPYSLPQGSLIIATVQALNSIGWSSTSTPNGIGQQVETAPLAAPPDLVVNLDQTDEQ